MVSQFPGSPLSVSVEGVKLLFGYLTLVQLALLIYEFLKTLLTTDTNADPTSPISSTVRWNIDECYEVFLLLKAYVL